MIKSFLKKQGYVTGFHPRVLQRSLQGLPSFIAGWLRYKKLNQGSGFRLAMADAFPILTDRFDSAGLADGHYFHQDLWAARKIHRARPSEHIDIGSRVDGFVAHLLTFMQVKVVDIRPLVSNIEGLTFIQDDATALSQRISKAPL